MKSIQPFKRIRHLSLGVLVTFVVAVAAPAVAAAQSADKLTRYLPQQSQLVVGLNIEKLRKSKYYKEALTWARKGSNGGAFLDVLENDAQIDLSKDLSSVAVSIPDTKVDKSGQQKNFTVAVSGSFDKAKLMAAIKKKDGSIKETKKGKTTIYSTGEVQFAFPKDGVLWLSAGPDSYRQSAWKAVGSSKHSVRSNKVFKRLLGKVNTSRGFWMLGDTSQLDTKKMKADTPQPKSIALSMDIDNGLDLSMLAELPSEDDAKSAVKQVEQLKQQGGQAAMLSILGAAPLVSNLKAKQKGVDLHATTSMTASEFDAMVQRLKQLAQSQMQSGGMPSQPVPNPNGPAKTGPAKSAPAKKDGANADFN